MNLANTLAHFWQRITPRSGARKASTDARSNSRWKALGLVVVLLLLVGFGLAVYWNRSPDLFNVMNAAEQRAPEGVDPAEVHGFVMTATLAHAVEVLLEKPGGYLSNDIAPPSVLMDDMANWEYGVVVQVRDFARSLRNDIARSRSQSAEDRDLAVAEPQFSFPTDNWMFPATEAEYRKGVKALDRYLARLANGKAEFFARADNLAEWLTLVNRRLGSLSQRLSASVGEHQVNTMGGVPRSRQAGTEPNEQPVYSKTPWLEVDDVFYEARGSAWAIIEFLRAAEIDFHPVLEDKNALVSMRNIIRELENSQRAVWSPMVLNGRGFGFTANYSLILTSYLARANAAILDLQTLLSEG